MNLFLFSADHIHNGEMSLHMFAREGKVIQKKLIDFFLLKYKKAEKSSFSILKIVENMQRKLSKFANRIC